MAILALAAVAGGCADPDPRIIASFRAGAGANGYSAPIGGPYFYYNPPTFAGGHVYIGTSRKLYDTPGPDNAFYKLDAQLRQVWAFPLGTGEVRGGAAVDDAGRIFFVVEKGRKFGDATRAEDFLYCLGPDGALLWSFQISAPVPSWVWKANDVGMYNPAVGADGTIYAGASKLYALDASGQVKWAYPTGGTFYNRMTNAPIIDAAGNLYFHADGNVQSLAPDGTLRWSRNLGDSWSSPAFSFDRTRVYAASGQTVHCLDAATGATIWSVTPPGASGDFRATPAVDDAGNVYLGTKANGASTFYAIGAGGTLLWQNHIGADLYSSPALGDDRTVYFGSEYTDSERRFHALDMATGAKRWSVVLPGMGDVTWSSPALAPGGVLYVGSMNGNVYAIRSDAQGLLAGAGSARFHEGNASTGRRE